MMLDGMRKASFGDPMFGSDQGDMYQAMMDDQLAVEMSQGKGLGLADMLIRQLSHGENMKPPTSCAAPGSDKACRTTKPSSSSSRRCCRRHKRPARELGVDPRAIIAQAALETGWGTSQPADASGDSHNLFGIKAGASWQGASVASAHAPSIDAGVAATRSRAIPRLRVGGSSVERLRVSLTRQPALLGGAQHRRRRARVRDRVAARRLCHRSGLCKQARVGRQDR